MHTLKWVGLCFGLIAIAFGCASGKRAPTRMQNLGLVGPGGAIVTEPGSLEQTPPNEAKDFDELQTLFKKGGFDLVVSRAPQFSKKYPRSQQLASVENLLGLSYLVTQRPQAAISAFKRSLSLATDQRLYRQYVLYNLAKAHFDANLLDDCRQNLTEIALDLMDRENRTKVHFLKARLYERTRLPLESLREAMVASQLLSSEDAREYRSAFSRVLDPAGSEIRSVEPLEALVQEFSSSPYIDALLYRLAALELSLGLNGASERHAKQLLDDFPDSPYLVQAKTLLASTQSQTIVDTRVVGVLLPLQGKYGPFGKRSLLAIQLAFEIFENQAKSAGQDMVLVIEDSGETAESALQALNALVVKHHAAVIIGPLLSKGITQVTQRAQELGVPLVSLARSPGQVGDYVFQAGMTLQLQAESIAKFAMDSLGAKRFAILASNDKVGEESAARFWDAVEKRGGRVVGIETYATGETDFRSAIDKLVGTHYTEARSRELEALLKERETLQIKKRTRKTEQYFALKPLIDFDAVFIPDEPKVAGQIIPTFAYRDVDGVKFLGTSAWNHPQFLDRTQGFQNHVHFVDAFFEDADEPEAKRFAEGYKKMTQSSPSAMEALAYDAGRIVSTVLKKAEPSMTRSDVRDLLRQVKGFPGASGEIRFEDGQYSRGLRNLTIQGGKITTAAR